MMTFDEAMSLYLRQFDMAVARVRAMLADWDVVERVAEFNKEAETNANSAIDSIFVLKRVHAYVCESYVAVDVSKREYIAITEEARK